MASMKLLCKCKLLIPVDIQRKLTIASSETVDGDQRKRSLTFRTTTPPKAAFADEVALGVVPQSIISDWNAAVQADAKDGVINKGVK